MNQELEEFDSLLPVPGKHFQTVFLIYDLLLHKLTCFFPWKSMQLILWTVTAWCIKSSLNHFFVGRLIFVHNFLMLIWYEVCRKNVTFIRIWGKIPWSPDLRKTPEKKFKIKNTVFTVSWERGVQVRCFRWATKQTINKIHPIIRIFYKIFQYRLILIS